MPLIFKFEKYLNSKNSHLATFHHFILFWTINFAKIAFGLFRKRDVKIIKKMQLASLGVNKIKIIP